MIGFVNFFLNKQYYYHFKFIIIHRNIFKHLKIKTSYTLIICVVYNVCNLYHILKAKNWPYIKIHINKWMWAFKLNSTVKLFKICGIVTN